MPFINDYFKNFNDQTAIIDQNNNSYKYEEIIDFDIKISQLSLTRALVFCLCENNIESVFGYFGFLENNLIPVLIDSKIDNDLLNNLILKYKPAYLWKDKNLNFNNYKLNELFSYGNYNLNQFDKHKFYKINENLNLLLSTSGSTGSSKFVRVTYNNLKSNAISISEYLSIDNTEKPITTLPFNYSFGLSIINSHFIKGSTILLINSSVLEMDFWKFFKKSKPTSISGVPFTFEMLKKLRIFRMELGHLKTFTQAGGKMNDSLILEYANYCVENNKRFYVMYGQTEACPRISYLPSDKVVSKLGSIGNAIPGGKLFIIDDKGNKVNKPNISGELVYIGKNVSLGYSLNFKDLEDGDVNKGMLYTGDIAYRDEDGFYFIIGRKKRFIKLFGNRINLDEVEAQLNNFCECACVGNDNILKIYLVDNNEKIVFNYLCKNLKLNPKSFSINLINEIPKNSSGKINYKKLKV